MKRFRPVLALVAYMAGVGLFGVISAAPAQATAIDNGNLDSLNHVRDYLFANYPGYLTYTKGLSILYRVNGTGDWAYENDTHLVVTEENRPRKDYGDEDDKCVRVDLDTFKFKVTVRSNMSWSEGKCGTTSTDSDKWTYEGGRVKIKPPAADVPVALWITDIDSANYNWQRIWFTPSAIRGVFTPNSGPKFNYDASDGQLYNNAAGSGLCAKNTDPRCNAIVLLSANEFYAKVSLKSSEGLMVINNDLTQEYRTLTFDPAGGCVTDNGGDTSIRIRSHQSGCTNERDYVRGDTARAFPTPSRPGYKFDYWLTSGGFIANPQPMTADVTLYAHWTQLPTYDLTPTVDLSSDTISKGSDLTASPRVQNVGTMNATNINWQLYAMVFNPGATIDKSTRSSTDGTQFGCNPNSRAVQGGARSCTSPEGGTAVSFNSNTMTNLTAYTMAGIDTSTLAIGSTVCFSLLVNPYNQDGVATMNYRESVRCALVIASPSLQVWGNDLRVGSAFATTAVNNGATIVGTLSRAGGVYRGSWVEYGAIAPSTISNFASGSGLNAPITTGVASDWSKLTFANTSGLGLAGSYAPANSLGQIPDVKTYLTGAAAKAGLNLDQRSGSVSVSAYVPNRVYIVSGTVTISNDIRNNSPRVGIANLTQMVIIADNINVSPNVTQIDAWLIAPGGTINTCVLGGADQRLSTNVCNQMLSINGPLMAGTVTPRRTSGEGATPAEVYNLRGDAYLWSRKVSEANGSIHTTYIRELPPRY